MMLVCRTATGENHQFKTALSLSTPSIGGHIYTSTVTYARTHGTCRKYRVDANVEPSTPNWIALASRGAGSLGTTDPSAEQTCQRCSSGQHTDLAHMVFSSTAMEAIRAKHARPMLQAMIPPKNARWLASFA